MDLHLDFAQGNISGDGNDDIGRLLIKGRYDVQTRECYWTKRYLGAHDVFYEGYREGKGIWGSWEIGAFAHGGFHIWPKSAGEGQTEAEVIEQPAPVEAIGKEETVGTPASRMSPIARRYSYLCIGPT